MPKVPQRQKRKADVTGNAVLVVRIATGEISESSWPPAQAYIISAKVGPLLKQAQTLIAAIEPAGALKTSWSAPA